MSNDTSKNAAPVRSNSESLEEFVDGLILIYSDLAGERENLSANTIIAALAVKRLLSGFHRGSHWTLLQRATRIPKRSLVRAVKNAESLGLVSLEHSKGKRTKGGGVSIISPGSPSSWASRRASGAYGTGVKLDGSVAMGGNGCHDNTMHERGVKNSHQQLVPPVAQTGQLVPYCGTNIRSEVSAVKEEREVKEGSGATGYPRVPTSSVAPSGASCTSPSPSNAVAGATNYSELGTRDIHGALLDPPHPPAPVAGATIAKPDQISRDFISPPTPAPTPPPGSGVAEVDGLGGHTAALVATLAEASGAHPAHARNTLAALARDCGHLAVHAAVIRIGRRELVPGKTVAVSLRMFAYQFRKDPMGAEEEVSRATKAANEPEKLFMPFVNKNRTWM